MLKEPNRTIGFFCPACRQAVIVERSAFQLAASHSTIECPCGESSLQVKILGDQVRMTVPCLLCEQDHVVTCSSHAFLHEKTIAFSCGASGLDCCYLGEAASVFEAMGRLEETVDLLEADAAASGMFLNDIIMEEILAELRDIGARGGISCSCGSKQWSMNVHFSAVELSCGHCGSVLKIPAGTSSDMEDLCCKSTLLIKGKQRE